MTDIDQVSAAAGCLNETELLGVVLNATRFRTPGWLKRRVGVLG